MDKSTNTDPTDPVDEKTSAVSLITNFFEDQAALPNSQSDNEEMQINHEKVKESMLRLQNKRPLDPEITPLDLEIRPLDPEIRPLDPEIRPETEPVDPQVKPFRMLMKQKTIWE